MKKGHLFVISGPSGVGKSTLLKKLFREYGDKLEFSVSCTSRLPRTGEENGVDYNFVSKEQFQVGIQNGKFLEWALVHNNYYGTYKELVDSILKSGKDCVLDIDVQGGTNLMDKGIEAHYIFIVPPSVEELKKRLEKRATETKSDIETRTNNALKELQYQDRYQYVVVNDNLEIAYNKLIDIMGY